MRKNSLRKVANHYLETNNAGNHRDKKQRYHVLHHFIDTLFTVGELPSSWLSIKEEHFKKVILHWRRKKIKSSTMMKHMTIIRKFLIVIGHKELLPNNKSLGLHRTPYKKKSIKLENHCWQKIEEPAARVLLSLQICFGLTLSEALRVIPDIHIKEHALWLTREITFNSVDRIIPLRNALQLEIIKELQVLTTNSQSLISTFGYDHIRFTYRKALRTIKLPSLKSYRYLYAQALKKEMQRILPSYFLSLLIMEEMGLKSRTTLWNYLRES